MTYRDVPQPYRLMAQLVTLGGTALLGASIAVTPPNVDPKLSQLERLMGTDYPAYVLIVFGTIGLIVESVQAYRATRNNVMFWVVSICHAILFGMMISYSLTAMISVVQRTPWNFAAPVLGVMVATWHYIYIRRRPHERRRTVAVDDAERI